MKTANASLIALLATLGNGNAIYGDLYTFALRNGTTFYLTDFDTDILQGGITFSSRSSLVANGTYKLQKGLEVDEMDLVIMPATGQTINGVGLLQCVTQGLFDRCVVTRQRQFMTTAEIQAGLYKRVITPAANAPIIFLGEVTDADITRTNAVLKIKSMLNLLNYNMPRRQYQANCSWVFGDTNCTFARASLTVSSTATTGSTQGIVLCSLSQANNYFSSGVLKFTSGKNTGVSRTVRVWVPNKATLIAPFPNAVAAGDTFTITPGCSKMLTPTTGVPTCNGYSNTLHYGGQPYVPVPESAY